MLLYSQKRGQAAGMGKRGNIETKSNNYTDYTQVGQVFINLLPSHAWSAPTWSGEVKNNYSPGESFRFEDCLQISQIQPKFLSLLLQIISKSWIIAGVYPKQHVDTACRLSTAVRSNKILPKKRQNPKVSFCPDFGKKTHHSYLVKFVSWNKSSNLKPWSKLPFFKLHFWLSIFLASFVQFTQ